MFRIPLLFVTGLSLFVSHVEQLSWTPTVQGLHGLTPKGSVVRIRENWGEGGP